MRTWLIAALVLAIAAGTVPADAQARRLGGGRPAGMQRSMPARTAPDAPPPKPAAPAQATPAQATPAQAAPLPAATPKRNWLGPLAGVAAGLGLAALFSHFGIGAGLGGALMVALVAAVLIFGLMALLRRGAARTVQPALAGGVPAPWVPPAAPAPTPAVERMPLEALPAPGAELTRAFVPASFDSEGFTRAAKLIFIRMQAANDAADIDDLRRFTTPELYASLRLDLQERGTAPQRTDVVKLDAEVLDVARDTGRQIVSVRFRGDVVEAAGAAPVAFDEVWHLVRPDDGSRDWAIAGIEPLG